MIRLAREGGDPEARRAAAGARAARERGGAAIDGFGGSGLAGRRRGDRLPGRGAGPGDPGLLTRRGRRAAGAGRRRPLRPAGQPGALLDLAPPSAELIDVGKRPRRRRPADAATPGRDRPAAGRARAARPAVVVRLKGGDPFVFGRGGEEAEALAAAGIALEVVPGRDLRLRRPGRGRHPGHPPRPGVLGDRGDGPRRATPRPGGRRTGTALARAGGTLVILMGMATPRRHRRRARRGRATAGHAGRGGRRGTTPPSASCARRWPAWPASTSGSPAVIVVGPVAGARRRRAAAPAGPAGRAHGGGHPLRAAGRALARRARAAGAAAIELPLTRQVDPADGGRGVARRPRPRGRELRAGSSSPRRTPSTASWPQLRDAPGAWAALGWPPSGRPRPTRWPPAGSSPISCRRSTARPGLAEAFPPAAGRGAGRVLFPAPTWLPTPSRTGCGEGLGRRPRSRRTARCRGAPPEPERRSARVATADALVASPRRPRCTRSSPCATPTAAPCRSRRTSWLHRPVDGRGGRAAGLAGVHEAWGASAEGVVAELGEHFGTGTAAPRPRGLVGLSPWRRRRRRPPGWASRAPAPPAAAHAGPAAPGGRDPPRGRRPGRPAVRARGDRRAGRRSPRCRARSSTRWTRSSSRPSGWSRSGSRASSSSACPTQGRGGQRRVGPRRHRAGRAAGRARRGGRRAGRDGRPVPRRVHRPRALRRARPRRRRSQRRHARALPARWRWPRPRRAPTWWRRAG